MMRVTPSRLAHRAFALLLVVAAVTVVAACGWFNGVGEPKVEVEGGDPVLGKQAILDYGCYSCHTIPGVNRADAHVGPALTAWADRRIIAGIMPNEPDNLIPWIISPQQFQEDSAMPTLGVSEEDARHIAAYLYTIED
ncbi:MAG: c-type cytochrome [Chloroflexota bacterium]|nr:c-type cytochrome [Chloroflexota bacterium]